jgi:pimeloyl-ACP methyl ester carboxylesterase
LFVYGGHTSAGTRLGEDYFLGRGNRVLAVSRPGYGRTPLATGATPDRFADALSEMLELLGISSVLVVGISAGGRSAIRFAARHANITDKLILQSSISFAPWPNGATRLLSYFAFNSFMEVYTWRMLRYWLRKKPISAIRAMIASLTTLGPDKVVSSLSHKHRQELDYLFSHMSSGSGFLNDIKTRDNDATDVTVPTLIIHSRYDRAVQLSHPRLLARQIKGSKLYLSQAESHLLWFSPHYEAIKQVMDEFLGFEAVIPNGRR